MIAGQLMIFIAALGSVASATATIASGDSAALHHYRASPKLRGPMLLRHDPNDATLTQLDEALERISTVYMQALFSGTHTPELEARMRRLEIELFDLLDALYNDGRMSEYMRYEAEVTRQMILYAMLKKLFGYSGADDEPLAAV